MSQARVQNSRLESRKKNSHDDLRENASAVLSRIIFLALLAVIALTAAPYGTVEAWWVAVFECVIFALTVLWIIEGLISGFWLVRSHRLLLPLLALIFFCFLQSLPSELAVRDVAGIQLRQSISADPFQTRLVALKLLVLLLAWAMLLRYTTNRRRLHSIIYTVLAVGVISALFGIVRQTTHHGQGGFILPYLRADLGYGQFINKNHFAFLMEMALGLALGIVVGGGVRRDQMMVYLAPALPVWTALVLSNSRGGLFAMLAQMLFLGLLFTFLQPVREIKEDGDGALSLVGRITRSTVFRVLLLTSLVAMVFIGALWMGGEKLATNLESVQNEVGSREGNEGASRRDIWRATWTLIKDHPIAGVGLGGYSTAIPQYHRASGRLTPQEAHNDYLELLASGGLIGVGIFIWFLLLFFRSVRDRLREAGGFARAASIGALVGIFGVAVHSFVDFGLHITINALIMIALLVITAGVSGRQAELPSV